MTYHEGVIQSPEEFHFTERFARYIDEIQKRPFIQFDESTVTFNELPLSRRVAEIMSVVQSPYALKPRHLQNTDIRMFAGKGVAKLPLSNTSEIETDSFITTVGLEWNEPGNEDIIRLLSARFFTYSREESSIIWTPAENATHLFVGINVSPEQNPYFGVFGRDEIAANPKRLAFPIARSLFLPFEPTASA